jgi:hypothetical protein
MWKELLTAYSSGGSCADMENLAQIKTSDSNDNYYWSNDDVIAVDVESAPKKPKSFGCLRRTKILKWIRQ